MHLQQTLITTSHQMDFHVEIMTKTNKAMKADAALGFPTPRRTEKYADILLDWWAGEVNHNFYIFEIPAVCKITFIKGSLTLKKKRKAVLLFSGLWMCSILKHLNTHIKKRCFPFSWFLSKPSLRWQFTICERRCTWVWHSDSSSHNELQRHLDMSINFS